MEGKTQRQIAKGEKGDRKEERKKAVVKRGVALGPGESCVATRIYHRQKPIGFYEQEGERRGKRAGGMKREGE